MYTVADSTLYLLMLTLTIPSPNRAKEKLQILGIPKSGTGVFTVCLCSRNR